MLLGVDCYWRTRPVGPVATWPGRPRTVAGHRHLVGQQYGDTKITSAGVVEVLETLARPTMTLPHLLWRASAVDAARHLQSTGAASVRLTVRQSALLGVLLRVIPRWELAPDVASALPLPPPLLAGRLQTSMVVPCFEELAAVGLWRASRSSSPPVWLISPIQAQALRVLWSEDLYVFSLSVDATVLCTLRHKCSTGAFQSRHDPPVSCASCAVQPGRGGADRPGRVLPP